MLFTYQVIVYSLKVEDIEGSKSSSLGKGKKRITKKVMEYCYEPEMEEVMLLIVFLKLQFYSTYLENIMESISFYLLLFSLLFTNKKT